MLRIAFANSRAVHYRIGSLEIPLFSGLQLKQVHYRIGSLES